MGARTERLDFRLAEEQKDKIESAAILLGESISSFAVSTLLQRANEVIFAHQNTLLTRSDAKQFIAMLDSNDKPNAKLKAAFGKHLKRHG